MGRNTSPRNTNKAQEARAKRVALLNRATGTDSSDTALVRLREIAGSLPTAGRDKSAQLEKIEDVLQTIDELAPRDAFERLLVTQMIAVHNATMECFHRAMIPGLTMLKRDYNLKHGEKLTAIYAMQLETLNKYRGKGQQKVTVEHVNVAAGGQAIVGNLEQGAEHGTAGAASLPRASSRRRSMPATPPNAREKLPVRIRHRKAPHG